MARTGRPVRPDLEDVFDLSKAKSPLSGMRPGQKIASVALLLLALIALIAFAAGRGGGSGSGEAPSAGFTRASYGASGADSTPTTSGPSSARASRTSQAGGVVSVDDLPAQARETIALIDAGGPYPYSRDGIVFGNFEHQLPAQARGWYHEYTVKTPGASSRGTRRIIVGKDGAMYYTDDHYRTFRKVDR